MFLLALVQLLFFLLLLPAALGLLFLLALRKNGYWQRRGIPGPKPVPIKGNLDSIFGVNNPRLQFREWTKQFGRVFGIQQGWNHVLVISEPDMVRQLLHDKFEYFHGRIVQPVTGDPDKDRQMHLLFAQGKRWKRLRSIANPAFSVGNLKKVMPLIDDSIRATMDLLDKAGQRGEAAINLHPYMLELSLDVISRIALGQEESCQFQSEYSALVKGFFHLFNNNPFDYIGWQFPWLGRNVLRPFIQLTGKLREDPQEKLKIRLREIVAERKKQRAEGGGPGGRRVDFIDLFLDAESAQPQAQNGGGTFNKMDKFERKNTSEEIVENCMLFLLAGYDTTSNSLSVACHNLALHPEVQCKVRDEMDSMLCLEEGEMASYEQLGQLKYTEAVFNETLRLCPVAGFNRICAETTFLGSYKVEKGTGVEVDTFTLHRDRNIWGEDADEFRPERWLEEDRARLASAFYGFGGGPRICIGMRLALMEEKMALAHLLRRFSIRKCAQTEEVLILKDQIVLNPESVTVKLEPRY